MKLKGNIIIIHYCLILLFCSYSLQAQDWSNKVLIDSIIDSKHINASGPGISICVAQDGRVIYERQVGYANVKKRIPITGETIFNLGSVSKQFTAACIMQLNILGMLSLDDSIQKYIPELPFFGASITINHLLSHTSGIPDHLEILGLKGNYSKARLDPQYTINFLKKAPILMFTPGADFSYCNTAYMLLAIVIERVSHKSINDFAKDQLFYPLKMNSFEYNSNEKNVLKDQVLSYNLKNKAPRKPQNNAMGATGVFGTLRDYVKWSKIFLGPNNDFASLSAALLHSYNLNDGSSINYGGGLILKPYHGVSCIEHSGGWNSFLMQFRFLPEQKIIILVASNTVINSPFGICDQITNLFAPEQSIKNNIVESISVPESINQSITGVYKDDNNIIRRLMITNDTVKIFSYSNSKQPLVYLNYKGLNRHSNYFFVDNYNDTIELVLNHDKLIKGFYWTGGHYFKVRNYYTKLGDNKRVQMNKLTGTYKSENYNQRVRIKFNRRKNVLQIKPIFFLHYNLENIGANYYKVKNDNIYLEFFDNYLVLGNEWVFKLKLKKEK